MAPISLTVGILIICWATVPTNVWILSGTLWRQFSWGWLQNLRLARGGGNCIYNSGNFWRDVWNISILLCRQELIIAQSFFLTWSGYERHPQNSWRIIYQGSSIEVQYQTQGLYSLSGKTYYLQIAWSFEAARLGVIMIVLLWNVAGISAALLNKYKPESRGIETSWDLAVRRLTTQWKEAQKSNIMGDQLMSTRLISLIYTSFPCMNWHHQRSSPLPALSKGLILYTIYFAILLCNDTGSYLSIRNTRAMWYIQNVVVLIYRGLKTHQCPLGHIANTNNAKSKRKTFRPESTRCCVQCVIPFNWCQSV